jgi:mono/diheme cytochrome c family protein
MPRVGLTTLVICVFLALSQAGCSDAFNAGPLEYVESEAMTKEVKGGRANLAKSPILQEKVRKALKRVYGDSPQHIKVPPGSGLPLGGLYLAKYVQEGEGGQAKYFRLYQDKAVDVPTRVSQSGYPAAKPQVGGYSLYRRNCLHCHGVSGAGDGPTAPFLYPTPRDYRKGIFKFTSTPSGKPPHRSDLRRTISNGLHGTSMPAFHSLMSPPEIEQVIDYVIFLSMRGESETLLIEEAFTSDEKDPNALSDEIVNDVVNGVFNKWKLAQTQQVNPPSPRTPPSRESVLAGRNLFLGRTSEKLECAGCHGKLAMGDGPSFVSQDLYNEVVFGGNPSERHARLEAHLADLAKKDKDQAEKLKALWDAKPDDWGNPLRPSNLNRGIYKGGRRPLDIFWRIAKGINGAQMPAHYPSPLDDKKVWDLVNFVLALPYEPELLRDAPPAPEAPPAITASREKL